MESNYSSYQNGNQTREQDFQKLSQTIGTSIQKISQNGSALFIYIMYLYYMFFVFSFGYATYGKSDWYSSRLPRTPKTIVSEIIDKLLKCP